MSVVRSFAKRVDAVVVGGGIAGSCTAAALAREGLDVVLCEPGLPSSRRLAGELMHPPAAQHLDELGLLAPLERAGAAPVYGFAVFRGPTDRGMLLSYSEVAGGRTSSVAIEHATMTRTLLDAVRGRRHVEVRDGARVTAIEPRGHRTVVTIEQNGEQELVGAPLVVLADGRGSKLGKSVGLDVDRGPEIQMLGWRVPGGRLPWPGYAHVFAHGAATTLAYAISPTEVRVMFEVGAHEELELPARLALLPMPFREDVACAIAREPRLAAKVFAVNTRTVVKDRVAMVGDAGGCVHPLTASGIAFCTRDAVELGRTVGEGYRADGTFSVPAALARYAAERRDPMRARAALGPALVDALTSDAPDMQLLRHGLFHYWSTSARGRRTSLGLLSTQHLRSTTLAREYASVCAHSVRAVLDGTVPREAIRPALVGAAMRAGRALLG
jgi:2-polyprenyl-6-methoxyphenol hydroxylase-like FAD-dependent oxidoreductase